MLEESIRRSPISVVGEADEKGFTLLHHAAQRSRSYTPGKVKIVLELVKEIQNPSDDELIRWVE